MDDYFILLGAFSDDSRQYFEKAPIDERQPRDLEQNLEIINDFLSHPSHRYKGEDRQPVTVEMTYDEERWKDVKAAIIIEGGVLAKDILKLPIKVF
jgi:hypothetical protein